MSVRIRSALCLALVMGLTANVASAATSFTNLSQSDFDKIGKEFSANSMLHNVSGAASLGSIFGFEVGLIAGAAKTPEVEKLVKEASPTTELSMMPHAGLIGALTVPFGITGELAIVPEVAAEGAKYSQYAGAVKWDIGSVIPVLPVNLAVRGFFSKSEFSFKQTINNASTGNTPVDVNVAYDGQVMGVQLLASPMIPVVEPYIGLGYLKAEGDLGVTGSSTASFFDSQAQSATTKPSSSQILLGVNVQLLVVVLGAEYSRAFGTDAFTGKLSLRF